MVQCTAAQSQGPRYVPSYVFLATSCESEIVPATVRINACKAFGYEGLRLRCTNRKCKHRPFPADAAQGDADVLAEFSTDDFAADGNTMDVDEQDVPNDCLEFTEGASDEQLLCGGLVPLCEAAQVL